MEKELNREILSKNIFSFNLLCTNFLMAFSVIYKFKGQNNVINNLKCKVSLFVCVFTEFVEEVL